MMNINTAVLWRINGCVLPPLRPLALYRHHRLAIRSISTSTVTASTFNGPAVTATRLSSLVYLAQPATLSSGPPGHQPLVLLLGWWRARPAHLAKYTRLHLARGSPVAFATLPPHCAVAPLLGLRRSLDDIATGLDRALVSHCPSHTKGFVVHTLSNNGPFAWALLPSDLTQGVGKAIHDSGPSLLTPEQLVRGTVGVAWPGGPDRVPQWAHRMARAYLRFPPHARIMDQLHQGLANMPQCPTLVLGGLQDPIVLPSEIQEFVAQYRNPKRTRVEWMDAGHVQLLRKYPDEYAKLVNDFISHTQVHE